MSPVILVLNGPGVETPRDAAAVGTVVLEELRDACAAIAGEFGVGIDFRATDEHDEILRWLEAGSAKCDALVVNPFGAAIAADVDLPRYRRAMRAAAAGGRPLIEVHVDNIFTRRAGLSTPLYEGDGDAGLVCGLGKDGYRLAIEALAARLVSNGTAT